MSFRAYVEQDFRTGGSTIWLVEQYGGQTLLHTHDPLRRTVELPEASRPDDNLYFAKIPNGAAHAILAELARMLGAVEHPEQLRADFEHVRARYDKVVDHLMTIISTATTRP